jgi:hypothetical protein
MFRLAISVLLLILTAWTLRAQDVTLPVVLERLHQYLRNYAEVLPATIAMERYNQRVGPRERIELESEFGIVRVPNNPQWLGFRDVIRVNGKPVESRDERLALLFENLTVSAIEQAGRISAESARFNIGPLTRSINDPALVLELLDGRNAHRMRVQKIREVTSNNIPTWIVRLRETGRPTLVRTSSLGDVPANGQAWIDPATGRLLRVQVTIGAISGVRCEVDVTFEKVPQVDFFVPARMMERCFDGAFVQEGEATYDNYRKFTVETRESIESMPGTK